MARFHLLAKRTQAISVMKAFTLPSIPGRIAAGSTRLIMRGAVDFYAV
jgi:hypothetical protein